MAGRRREEVASPPSPPGGCSMRGGGGLGWATFLTGSLMNSWEGAVPASRSALYWPEDR